MPREEAKTRMTADLSPDFCPYKGLQPYTEADRAFFFGREREQEIIASNLYAAPLTVLYGASGVGKTSVLMAGVVPLLRKTPRLAVVTFRTWQSESFLFFLKAQIFEAVSRSAGKEIRIDTTLPLDEFLLQHTRALRGPLFVIFDQFEEYFLYQTSSEEEDNYEAALARAINRREVNVNFLFALREDGLSKLDRFKGRIPNLLGNTLRLEHLDREAAVSAIRKPLAEYNRRLSSRSSLITIEDTLVDSVIHQVQAGQVILGEGGKGNTGPQRKEVSAALESEIRIESPYLQLVMTRVWEDERKAGSNILRVATLDHLGGAERIVQTHLDATMAGFSNPERLIAARAFRYLVTPSGTKIAYTASDLANYTNDSPEKLSSVFVKLSRPDKRVLRGVAPPPGQAQEPRYEIFHDVLAPAILDWRARYLDQIRTRRLRIGGALVSAIVLAIIVFLIAYIRQTSSQLEQTQVQANAFGTAVRTLVSEPVVAAVPTLAPETPSSVGPTSTPSDIAAMVTVPAGPFLMGSVPADKGFDDETPQHLVYLDEFSIDKYEVTNAQYNGCVQKGICSQPLAKNSFTRDSYFDDPKYDSYPVVNVRWIDAKTYCESVQKRLPTEAEWEKAARGTDGRIFPWGNSYDVRRLNASGGGKGDTTAVGSFPTGASPYGALDMAGNVWEWVADWYASDYYQNSPSRNPTGPLSGHFRVMRGGSWSSPQSYFRTANRGGREVDPNVSFYYIGFRCGKSTSSTQTFQCRITKEVGSVNLHAGPGASFQSIKLLQPDNVISIKGWTDPVGQSGTAWFQVVSTDNQEGWIISRPYPERGLDYACNFDVSPPFPFPRVSFPK